jgi:hypothetical protein
MLQLTRRRFVAWAAVGVGAVGAGLATWRTRGYHVEAAIATRLRLFAPWQYLVVQAAGARIVHPESVNVGLFADAYLVGLPAADRRDVSALIGFVEHGAPLLTGRFERFTALDSAAQDEVLQAIERHRVGRVRAGFNVLKAVAFMALYEQDSSWPAIGYPGPLVPQEAS